MDKKKEILFNTNNFMFAMSNALDSIITQYYNTSKGHSLRVAYISLKLAKEFNYSNEGLSDICTYSFFHSIALKKTGSKNRKYCEFANEYCQKIPFLLDEKDILKYSCEHYDGSGNFGLKKEEIPLFSQFIFFADSLDCSFDLSKSCVRDRKSILKYVQKNQERLYSRDIAECFFEFTQKDSFWLDLQNEQEMISYIFGSLLDYSKPLGFEKVLEITSIFYNLIDENGKLIEKCAQMADFYGFDHKDKETFLIAASLTNLGKFFIKDTILDKNATFDEHEYMAVKAYPYYTKKILSQIIGFSDICTWASRVQEFINGKGYPYSLEAKDLSFKDRLLAVTNIFNALTSNSSFRSSYTKSEAYKILDTMANDGNIDKTIVEDLKKVFGK